MALKQKQGVLMGERWKMKGLRWRWGRGRGREKERERKGGLSIKSLPREQSGERYREEREKQRDDYFLCLS